MKEPMSDKLSKWGWVIPSAFFPVCTGAALWFGSMWWLTKAEFATYQKTHQDAVSEKVKVYDDQFDTIKRRQDNTEAILLQILPSLKAIETKLDMVNESLKTHMAEKKP